MCGIIGIVGRDAVAGRLLEGLKRLEYRGYDSAGIATLVDGGIERRRAEGKLQNLETRLSREPVSGVTGIGHTRWATHGVPNEVNAHPHATGRVALVHNGIIENFLDLKAELEAAGHKLASDTDTEVVAHLITHLLEGGMEPIAATEAALGRLDGAFALGIIFAGHHDLMIAARRGSPLAIGYGEGETFIGSDALALAPMTQRITYLEDGDWAVIEGAGVAIRDASGANVERPIVETGLSGALTGKDGHPHYMLKEIFEQPQVIGDTLHSFLNPADQTLTLPDLALDPAAIAKITISACGTAYYAGLCAKYWFEQITRVPVEVDIASEFRYREADMPAGGLAIFISQSGETADTLAALRHARDQGQHILSIVNVPECTIARESDTVLRTYAGPEIGVASTKAFTTQLTVLAVLAIVLARARGAINHAIEARLAEALTEVPARAAEVLNHDERLRELAQELFEARDVLFLGRGTSYPIALEGALKLKEISYIHAEGYAAGEMKHGPIALIDDGVPVIVIAPTDALFEKTASNMQEVIARGGRVIFLSDAEGAEKLGGMAAAAIALPSVDPFVAPILHAIPVQLLAYHTAVLKGTDVDQPRNLAKSVTVE
ncbi:MAG: glutamine--fructose-6-phosphate transaminase (isomerizing) [Rhodospirillales bacterium]|jgi:glucosamine--fructose-6-phosphate aminotransferase (isomerizing)|nr:glutamine--fructose-6-phosphate transaminase (isomerizing) [Rhodospirillales bacterium]MDP6843769.1 glutamine--fructose-6-phosphate transaminase (isomerizing) [Rhodospirillales bacterium]|tara:strand:+ start:796 stop:2619 length:1824 start_codon:yes stop_codon:yes gene_type:complete